MIIAVACALVAHLVRAVRRLTSGGAASELVKKGCRSRLTVSLSPLGAVKVKLLLMLEDFAGLSRLTPMAFKEPGK